jgi:hypothetical protein
MQHYKYLCSSISREVILLQHPTAQSAMKVNLAAQTQSQTGAAGLSALVATGKNQCTVCYELCSVMKEVANENNEALFSKLFSQEPSCDQTDIVVINYL